MAKGGFEAELIDLVADEAGELGRVELLLLDHLLQGADSEMALRIFVTGMGGEVKEVEESEGDGVVDCDGDVGLGGDGDIAGRVGADVVYDFAAFFVSLHER